MPTFVIGLIGYSAYVYCYVFAWKEVHDHHSRRAGAAYIALYCAFMALVLIDWALIHIIGPGRVTNIRSYALSQKIESFVDAVEPPPAFISDNEGYTVWCSVCQQMKPDRVHHSAELGYCVDKMDHFCNWLGAVIGRQNYRYFFLLQIHFITVILISFFTIPFYIRAIFRNHHGGTHAHIIVMMAFGALWLVLLIPFISVHTRYTVTNITTLEQIKFFGNNSQRPIFNIKLPQWAVEELGISCPPNESRRIVSRIQLGDPKPYDRGSYWANWCETMTGNPLLWVLPFPTIRQFKRFSHFLGSTLGMSVSENFSYSNSGDYYEADKIYVNPKFTELAIQRFLANEEGYYAYPHHQDIPPALYISRANNGSSHSLSYRMQDSEAAKNTGSSISSSPNTIHISRNTTPTKIHSGGLTESPLSTDNSTYNAPARTSFSASDAGRNDIHTTLVPHSNDGGLSNIDSSKNIDKEIIELDNLTKSSEPQSTVPKD